MPTSLILGCGQCRALGHIRSGMVISISPARMRKLVGICWNAFELGFAVWKFVTLKRKTGPEQETFPDPAATFRDLKATLRDQRFFMHYLPLGPEHVPVEAHPRPNSNMFMPEQTLAIATSRCVTAEDIGTWNSLGKTKTLLGWLGKTKKCIGIVCTSKETCWDNYWLNLNYSNQKMWWDSLGKPRQIWKCI